jgi:hypothetical protein
MWVLKMGVARHLILVLVLLSKSPETCKADDGTSDSQGSSSSEEAPQPPSSGANLEVISNAPEQDNRLDQPALGQSRPFGSTGSVPDERPSVDPVTRPGKQPSFEPANNAGQDPSFGLGSITSLGSILGFDFNSQLSLSAPQPVQEKDPNKLMPRPQMNTPVNAGPADSSFAPTAFSGPADEEFHQFFDQQELHRLLFTNASPGSDQGIALMPNQPSDAQGLRPLDVAQQGQDEAELSQISGPSGDGEGQDEGSESEQSDSGEGNKKRRGKKKSRKSKHRKGSAQQVPVLTLTNSLLVDDRQNQQSFDASQGQQLRPDGPVLIQTGDSFDNTGQLLQEGPLQGQHRAQEHVLQLHNVRTEDVQRARQQPSQLVHQDQDFGSPMPRVVSQYTIVLYCRYSFDSKNVFDHQIFQLI